MAKPRKIWAVTSGSYSDYDVVALFERKEDADLAQVNGMGDDVQEMTLFPPCAKPRRVMVHRAHATAHRKGRLADVTVRVYSNPEWDFGDNPAPRRPRLAETRYPGGAAISYVVTCANAELAEKALRDRLAQTYADWAGVTA